MTNFSHRYDRNVVKRGRAQSAVGFVALVALSGCASIISGRRAEVAFDSYPSNAHVVIHDNVGREVASLKTPGVVSLRRNRRFFMPARYVATIETPGYQPAQVPLRSTVNPWILGNVIIGGIPGLVVDTATGAAWMPRQSEIHQQLAPLYGPQWGPWNSPDAASQHEPIHAAELASHESLQAPVDSR